MRMTKAEMEAELEKPLEERAEEIRNSGRFDMAKLRPMMHSKGAEAAGNAREIYKSGRRFTVAREGARIEGIVTWGDSAWAGYYRGLDVGDILTCNGWRVGMDGKTEEVNFTADGLPWNALWMQVWPQDGLFRPWPMTGWLAPIDDTNEMEN